MEPIGSWTLEGICREVDPVQGDEGRERCSPRVRRLGMLKAPGAEGAWWDVRQREIVCIPKYPAGKLERERQREKREGKSTNCRGGM
jgi:hypothetical protein